MMKHNLNKPFSYGKWIVNNSRTNKKLRLKTLQDYFNQYSKLIKEPLPIKKSNR